MNQEQFIQECGKSYPDAMAALGYFRQIVQQRLGTVVEESIEELCDVIGVSSGELKLIEYADPDKPASTVPDLVELGWKAKRLENLYIYFYLYWLREPDEDSAPQGVAITIWINDRKKREALGAKLDQLCDDPAFRDDPWIYETYPNAIEFSIEVNEGELAQVASKLDQLSDYTVRFLRSVEGIESYFQV